MNSFQLSHKPIMELSVSLNGLDPEVRISTDSSSFVLSKEQFLELYELREEWINKHNTANITSEEDDYGTKMNSTKGELLFYREIYTEAQPYDLEDNIYNRFYLNHYATRKFVYNLPAVYKHVQALCDSRDVIIEMYEAISKVYVHEYNNQSTPAPLQNNFLALIRSVGSYVSPSKIIRDFNKEIETKGLECVFSIFSLYSIASVQFDYIQKIVNSKV